MMNALSWILIQSLLNLPTSFAPMGDLPQYRCTASEWKLGETAEYQITKVGLKVGSLIQVVGETEKRESGLGAQEGIWVLAQLKAVGETADARLLVDRINCEVIDFVVDGKSMEPPLKSPSDGQVIGRSRVKVPAGTFDVVEYELKDGKDTSKMAFNEEQTAMFGQVKGTIDTDYGKFGLELVSFERRR